MHKYHDVSLSDIGKKKISDKMILSRSFVFLELFFMASGQNLKTESVEEWDDMDNRRIFRGP